MKTICRGKNAKALCMGLCLMLCLMLCASLAGCGNKANDADKTAAGDKAAQSADSTAAKDPAAVVEEAFSALQQGDLKKAKTFIPDLEELEDLEELNDAEDADGEEGNRLLMGMMKRSLENLEYKVGDVTRYDGDDAVVSVEVSNLDMTGVVEEFYNSMIDAMLEDEKGDGEISDAKMDEMLDSLTADLKKNNKVLTDTLQVEVEDGTVDLTEEQLDAMLGGLLTAADKMDE